MIEIDPTPTYEAAIHVNPGLLLDLEGDPYADPNGDGTCTCTPDCTHYYSFEFEYGLVVDAIWEGPDTILLTIADQGTFAFPPDHEVTIVGKEVLDA